MAINNLSATVKALRKRFYMTQQELALKSGVGLRFIRELEQGKPTLRLDKVNQVLDLFNFVMEPVPKKKDDEIVKQLRLLSGNTELKNKALAYLKGLTSQSKLGSKADEQVRTKSFLDDVAGKWTDNRSADEIINDIYSSRKNKDDEETTKLFDS